MRTRKHPKNEQLTLAVWQQQLQMTRRRPWLASLFLQRARHRAERFAYFYQQLRSLPRRWRRRIQRGFAAGLLGASLLLSWGPAPSVHAATITITPNASGVNGGDGCSLMEAIINANNNNQSGSAECTAGSGADTIMLAGNSYSYNSAYNANNALPQISSTMTIDANGSTIRRSGGGQFRLLEVVPSGNLTLNRATITGGSGFGGIYNRGSLTLNESVVTDNHVSSSHGGGGIANRATGGNATLTLNKSSITHNTAEGGYVNGGGIANVAVHSWNATVTMNHSTISNNDTDGGDGAGLYNQSLSAGNAITTLNNVTITANRTGFIFAFPSADSGIGGGIYNGSGNSVVNLNRTIIAGNSSNVNGREITDNSSGVTGGNRNLFGHSLEDNSTLFSGFLPSGNDINGSSDGSSIDLVTVLERGVRDRGTLSHSLVSGSPAIDAIPTTDAACNPGSTTDQHGAARANGAGAGGAACDIGAVEYNSLGASATIVVSGSATGTQNGDGCSLVEAIVNANDDVATYADCTAGFGDDVITLAGNTYTYSNNYGGPGALPTVTGAVTIEGNGATIERNSGAAPFRLMTVYPTGDVVLDEVTISGGQLIVDSGGGILVLSGGLTLQKSAVTNNSARDGGGIHVAGSLNADGYNIDNELGSSGQLTIQESTITGNSASRAGGGIHVSRARLMMTGSTVANNTADDSGGGVSVEGSWTTIENSTISGNQADIIGGGFIALEQAVTNLGFWRSVTAFEHVTVTDNEAGLRVGGIWLPSGDHELKQSIVSGNVATSGGNAQEIQASRSGGYNQNYNYILYPMSNAISDTVIGHNGLTANEARDFSIASLTNVLLATSNGNMPTALTSILETTLADNGGSTQTHNLVAGSPAIDLATTGLGTGQRGELRPFSTNFDAGAVEFLPALSRTVAVDGVNDVATINFTVGYQLWLSSDPYGTFSQVNDTNGVYQHAGGATTPSYWEIRTPAGTVVDGFAVFPFVIVPGS
ncbi:MAG: choice-of-anchor Q domain-containing protein [Chloroflexota bacterium]